MAERFGVSRQEQDEFAAASHRKAAAAQAAGRFQQEIVPVHTVLKDAQTGHCCWGVAAGVALPRVVLDPLVPRPKLVGTAGFAALGPPLTHTTALCTTPTNQQARSGGW